MVTVAPSAVSAVAVSDGCTMKDGPPPEWHCIVLSGSA